MGGRKKKYNERCRICLDCTCMEHDVGNYEVGICLVDGHRIDHINNYEWCEHYSNPSWRRTQVHNSDGYAAEASDAFNNKEYPRNSVAVLPGQNYRVEGEPDRNRKAVRCRETGKVYPSIREASKVIKRHASGINKCVRGRLKTAYGYHWEYVKE